MSSTQALSPRAPKPLVRESWHEWISEISPYLAAAGHARYVNPSDRPLRVLTTAFIENPANTAVIISVDNANEEILRRRSMAVGAIRMCLSPALRKEVEGDEFNKDGKMILDHFKAKFEKADFSALSKSMSEFVNIRQGNHEAADDYIIKVSQLATKLRDIIPAQTLDAGASPGSTSTHATNVSDVVKLFHRAILIRGIRNPLTKNHLVMAADPSIEDIETALINSLSSSSSLVRAAQANDHLDDHALAANNGSCHWCRRPGHYVTECSSYKAWHDLFLARLDALAKGGKNELPRAPRFDPNFLNNKGKGKASVADAPASAKIANASIMSSSASNHLPSTSKPHADSWNADSGATRHMAHVRGWFKGLTPNAVPIQVANGGVIHSEGVGDVEFLPVVNGVSASRPIVFKNVLYVPVVKSKSVFDQYGSESVT